jgi:hypothetical protein
VDGTSKDRFRTLLAVPTGHPGALPPDRPQRFERGTPVPSP